MNIENIIQTKAMPYHRKTVVHLMYTANTVADKISEVLKPFDISIQQFNVLRILRGQKGNPVNLFTIQERMIHKMSNTTRLVDKLIRKDLVKRKICPQNRRKVEINITAKGLDLLTVLDEIINAIEKNITKNLTQEECMALNMLLEKIRS
ncbi:MAG: MarR family transcriptional regulator [Sinomicrobium sp.]|nr:MarR family transcriptional regulator [Sinomicrobium sp.]